MEGAATENMMEEGAAAAAAAPAEEKDCDSDCCGGKNDVKINITFDVNVDDSMEGMTTDDMTVMSTS